MLRVFGALAAFGGWLSILISAGMGLLATEMFGLGHTEGPLPPSAVYGIPEVLLLWILVGAALLASVPIGAAILTDKPGRSLFLAAAVMAAVGIALLPDELGRVHALAILPGAGAFVAGGYLISASRLSEEGAMAAEGGAPDGAPETVAPAAPAAAARTQAAPVAAGAHKASAAARSRARRGSAGTCSWCSAGYRAGATTCASCGAALKASPAIAEEAIPGLTIVDPQLRDYAFRAAHPAKKQRPSLVSVMMGDKDDRILDPAALPGTDPDAFRPPSDQLRLEMDRLEKEIEAAAAAAHESPADAPPISPSDD